MKKQFIFCILSLLFFQQHMYAQNNKLIDSLKKLIIPLKTDTKQVDLLNKIAWAYSTSDSVNTFSHADKAIEKATILKYNAGLARALDTKGNYFVYKTNPAKALPFLENAASLWLSVKDNKGYAGSLQQQAQAYSLLNKYNHAIELLYKAETIFIKLNDKPGFINVYHSMGTIYSDNGEKEKAIEFLLKSLKLQEQTGETSQIRSTQNNLGRLLVDMKNYAEAIKYYNQSIQNSLKTNDWRNLGITQLNIANMNITQGNYQSGIDYLNRALLNFKKIDFKRGIQTIYNNLGAVNLRMGNYTEAITQLNSALELAQASPSKAGLALIEQNIAYGFAGLKKYEDALSWYKKAEVTAIQYAADPFTFGEIYNHRSSLDSAMGNYETALQYRTKFVSINDKLLNEKISKQVLELQTRYETEKKEFRINILNKSDSIKSLKIQNQQIAISNNLLLISEQTLSLLDANLQIANDSIELFGKNQLILQHKLDSTQKQKIIENLDKQKQIQSLKLNNKNLEVAKKNSIIAAISLLFLLVAFFGFYFYKKRSLQQEANMQAAINKQKELATIAILTAEEKERKRIASDLHDGVGQLMTAAWLNLQAVNDKVSADNNEYSQLIHKTMLLVNESMKEVRTVSHNMMPNALLKKGLINAIREFIHQLDSAIISINLQAEGLQKPLNSHTETILNRVIQECVNNVIKHAQATHLDISINNDDAGIDVMIEDNGKGFDVKAALAKDNGLGLQNIQSRIQYLHGTVDWDSVAGNGTVVAIHIPLAV